MIDGFKFVELVDLASERLGGNVLFASDEFFAPKENLLRTRDPVFIEGKYTALGKWMDGWETRRRRTPGHDWCVIRLGTPGKVRGIMVDTSHFKGNFPEHCSIDGAAISGNPSLEKLIAANLAWTGLLPKSRLEGDSRNLFSVDNIGNIDGLERVTHLRLKIFPDGGIARLRVYGEVLPDWEWLRRSNSEVDLAAIENGALVLASSDMFFGHRHNLIMPGRAADMSDGWETRRRRGPGHDWVIIKLGTTGTIERAEVDTSHFRGNFPESCSMEACQTGTISDFESPLLQWTELLPRTKLQGHTRHLFEDEVRRVSNVTHVRFNIFPDGGVSRLRLFGRI